jgi:hypothetical protein
MQGNGWLTALVTELQGRAQAILAGAAGEVGPLDLAALEQEVQQALRQVGRTVVELRVAARVAEVGREVPVCASCQGRLRRVGELPRVLVGLVGDYVLRRPYYSCAACHVGGAPLDAELGLGGSVLSPALAEVAAYEAVKGPFAEAARALSKHHGLVVDAETVRALAEDLGQLVEVDQRDSTLWGLPEGAAVPAVLAVELDGVLVHERASWRELKGGRVAPLGPGLVRDRESGEEHYALGTSTYCLGLEGADPFWQRLMREVVRAGWQRGVQTVVVLADGAEWIWHQARTHLQRPGVEVVEILDFYHVTAHLSNVADAVFGPQTLAGVDWLARQCQALRHQGPAPILQALGTLAPPDATSAETVRKVVAYVRGHAARMDYPAFRARLFPIGSGAIESTVKNLVQARQVQAGMRWSAAGAQTLASLRALSYSADRWDPFWRTKPLHRLRLLPPAALAPATDLVQASAPAAARPAAATHHPDAPVAAPAPPPAPLADHIRTAGKPWVKGKGYWRRVALSHQRAIS